MRYTIGVMAKKKSQTGAIVNRRASFDYDLEDTLVVGIQLTGAETKSLRQHHGHIKGAYVTVKDNELWLTNATITGDNRVRVPEETVTRPRKLLAKRKEIEELIAAKQQGRSIIPVAILPKGRFVKVRIAVGKGKKHYDKRDTIKKRQDKIEASRAIKRHI